MSLISRIAVLAMCLSGLAMAQATAPPASAPATRATTRPTTRPRTAADAVTPTTRPIRPRDWLARHEGFLKLIQDQPKIDLLFIGDSITDFWRNRGAEVWKRFEKYNPANFGISGDQTQWVLWRLQNGELEGIKPKLVVIMIGTNNVGNNRDERPEWAAAGVTRIVQTVREKLPESKVLLLAVFPCATKDSTLRAQVAEMNQIIARLHDGQHVFYLDIGDKFLGPDGELPPAVMPDKLHPTTQGYEIWYDSMIETIDRLMQ